LTFGRPRLYHHAGMDASEKAAWRQRVRQSLALVSPDERAAASGRLCDVLLRTSAWTGAASVLCFAPLRDEPDIMPVIASGLRAGKRIALPSFDPQTGCYVAGQIVTEGELPMGQFGVREPGPGCPVLALNQLDLILVPGVAFDLTGRRLGRGKGFYDRLLAEVRGHKCGVAFEEQIVAGLPEEPHDVRVDSILTPSQWRLRGAAD
jgi:5-formyltetrahydrofolate cyclo-ligase